MLTAFLLGLTGSVGHCTGMCGGVALLLGGGRRLAGPGLLLLHLGRVSTYAALGALAGGFGQALAAASGHTHHGAAHGPGLALPGLTGWQGVLALLAAAGTVYMAFALLGRVPSPEILFARATRGWGRLARSLLAPARRSLRPGNPAENGGARLTLRHDLPALYALGLFWGLLPCGLVLAGLLLAAAGGSAAGGALTMLAFGLGTWPVALGASLFAGWARRRVRWMAWLRHAAAAVVLLAGLQMALRGLAAWDLVAHGGLGGLMLW